MRSKVSTLQKYIDVFGEHDIINSIENARKRRKSDDLLHITNPILRMIANTSYIHKGKLYSRAGMQVPPNDYNYFRLAAGLLSDLKPELEKYKSYRKQLYGKILHRQDGPMLSGLNEIIVAGYCKSLGLAVKLNSSREEGSADIDLEDIPFAIDAKIFNNSRILFEAAVNNSAQEIESVTRHIRNQGLLIHVHVPDGKKLRKSLQALAKAFRDDSEEGRYEDDTISATIIENDYGAADFQFNIQPNNVNIMFQASWDMWPSIQNLKEDIEKAVEQCKRVGKQAIPWIMVPRDAARYGIEVQILRFEGKFHQYVQDNPDIYIMPVYSLDFNGKQFSAILDVFQTGSNIYKIKQETFVAYIQNLMSRPEIHV